MYVTTPKVVPPTRIAHVIGKMSTGGVESVVFGYYREMNKSLVQYDFFYDMDSATELPEDLIKMGAMFYKLPPYQKIWKYIPELKRYFDKNQYTIVHSHLNTLSVFPLGVAWLCGVPVRIAHNHSVPQGKKKADYWLKCFLRLFAKVFPTECFSCSEKAGRWLFGNQAYERGEVRVIRNAISFDRFRVTQDMKRKSIRELGLDGKFVVGHVGRFTYAKNHKFLLEVFARIKELRQDAVLILVGDGELRDEIERDIERRNLKGSVIMTGRSSRPEYYHSAMDVALYPSIFEGLPTAVIEAQISGIPVILSEATPREAIISNGCKYLDLNESAEVWARCALEQAVVRVVLTSQSDFFNIRKAGPDLENWYLERTTEARRKGGGRAVWRVFQS